ncbi:MAG: M20 family metallopeptidase [Anaerolineales bacterium]|nr:MAG: M20 family metallopeptidase [Anaerolineales bacterium]
MLTDVEKHVLAHIDPDQVVAWTQELVRIPSVFRPQRGEGEEQAAAWVQARLEEMGLETHWEVVAPTRPNVIGLLRGADGHKTLMFEGHTDVVTEGDADAWTHAGPFSAKIVDGRIYGRGANDMKGGLVAAMCAIQALVKSGVKLKGDILIGALVDEEGLMLGVKHFVEKGWADIVDAAIICEPEENHLCIAQKGVMWGTITCTGIMSHGAMPLTGVNPIYPMASLLTKLRELEAAEIARLGAHQFLGQPSITPTILQSPVHGEAQNNVMPAQVQLTLDCRLIPGQTAQDLEAKIQALFDQVKTDENTQVQFAFEVIEARAPTFISEDAEIVQVLAASYQDVTGKAPVYGGVPGTTDGTILFSRANVPIVTCGPGDIHIPHHIDEWLSIEELIEATRLYAVAALRFLGVAA